MSTRDAGRVRLLLQILLLAGVYACVAKLGLALSAVSGYATLIWPPTAIALVALIKGGRRLWPGVALGVLALNLWGGPASLPVSLGIAAGNTLEAVLGAWAVERFVWRRGVLARPVHVAGFVVLAALGSTLVSATVGTFSLSLAGAIPHVRPATVWWPWWLGDATADIILAPLLLAWSVPPHGGWRGRGRLVRWLEAGALAGGLLAFLLIAFESRLGSEQALAQPTLILPFLMWAALRFGVRGATASTLLTSLVAIWSTARGHGPFVHAQVATSLVYLQVFMAVVAVVALGLATAIAERDRAVRAAEAALVDADRDRQNLQTIFDSARVGMMLVDRGLRVVRVNDTLLALTGQDRAALVGGPPGKALGCADVRRAPHAPGEDPTCAGCGWQGTLARLSEGGPDVAPAELQVRRELDGQEKDAWFTVSAAAVLVDGARHGLVTVVDVTERKRLEQQLVHSQKMESIGQLAGGVAHDFNNLLTAILGASHMVESDPGLSPDARECNREIMQAGERAAELTQSLLAFSRRQVLAPARLDLNAVLLGFQRTLGRLLRENVQVVLELHPEPLVVTADRGMLEQVIMNLAMNAGDAMPDGGTLLVGTTAVDVDTRYLELHRQLESPGRYAILTVSDTGQGMDEATRQRVFEPFFTTKEMGRGTGLGLSIVYGIVRQHRGGVDVYSEPGQGTTFRVSLPLSQGPAEVLPAERAPAAAWRGTGTVLVAEDDAGVRKTVRRILEGQGYEVIEAADGADAVRVYRERPGAIRLVLADVVMPRLNGRRMLEELRRIDPDVPILFMSGYSADLISRQGILEPGMALVTKPLQPQVLLERARELIEGAARSRPAEDDRSPLPGRHPPAD